MSLLLTLNLFRNFFLLFLLLKLKRSLLAGNYSSNCHVFMFISVLHNMAIMSLQTHFIHWKKFKKLIEKCLLPHWYIDVLIYWYFWHYLKLPETFTSVYIFNVFILFTFILHLHFQICIFFHHIEQSHSILQTHLRIRCLFTFN